MYASVIKREQAKLEVSKKPEKHKRIATNEIESDDEMSVQVICAPKSKRNNTSDFSAEEMEYQKKLKWLKDHGEFTGDERNNPAEVSSGNESA